MFESAGQAARTLALWGSVGLLMWAALAYGAWELAWIITR